MTLKFCSHWWLPLFPTFHSSTTFYNTKAMCPSEPRKKKNSLTFHYTWVDEIGILIMVYYTYPQQPGVFFGFHCSKWFSILWYPSLDTTPVHQFPRPSFVATPRYQHRQWQPMFRPQRWWTWRGWKKQPTRHSKRGIRFVFLKNDGHVKCLQQKKGCTTFRGSRKFRS